MLSSKRVNHIDLIESFESLNHDNRERKNNHMELMKDCMGVWSETASCVAAYICEDRTG